MNKQTTSKKTIKNTNTKKKRDIINIILLIMLFVILCTGVYFACTLQKFRVLSIQVKGNERLDFKTIAQISGIKYEENLFLLSKREVVERLKNNPYIEDVAVVKKVPNSVFIQVKEKKVIGYISSEGNSYLIDSNGKIIDVVPVDKTRRTDSKIEKKGFDKENTSPDNTVYNPLKYYNYLIGHNSRLDEIQAAILRVKLPRLDEWNDRRRTLAKRYNDALEDVLTVPRYKTDEGAIYHLYIVQSEERDKMTKKLGEKGIATGVYYPVPLHLQKAFGDLGYRKGDLPVGEYLSERTFALPMFPEMTEEEQDYIIESVRA